MSSDHFDHMPSQEAARFLQQAQFSSNLNEIQEVTRIGPKKWLDQQMSAPRAQSAWDWLEQNNESKNSKGNYQPVNAMLWNQLIAQPDGVRKRIALALSEYFVISMHGLGGVPKPKSYTIAAYWDLLLDHAFGNFRDLLEAVTLSFPMGKYLSMLNNLKGDPETGRAPDENYAREVMQLFTIGLVQLNLDGTPKLDPHGNPIETYQQSDITNIAKVLTGWVAQGRGLPKEQRYLMVREPMRFIPRRHAYEAVEFLGTSISADTEGPEALNHLLDHLFNHPNMAPFFSKQMIQRLVTSNPSPSYVKRVATVFNDNGQGVRGDLRAVFSSILLDKEARHTNPNSVHDGKFREPMICFMQWAKTFSVQANDGNWRLPNPDKFLGQSPFAAPSVFNFFQPGYAMRHRTLRGNAYLAPELEIISESTVAGYANFMQVALTGFRRKLSPDYSEMLAMIDRPEQLVAHLNLILCAGQMKGESQSIVINALTSSRQRRPEAQVLTALYLTMISPEYRVLV